MGLEASNLPNCSLAYAYILIVIKDDFKGLELGDYNLNGSPGTYGAFWEALFFQVRRGLR